MERRTFIGQSCTCVLVSLLGVSELYAQQSDAQKPEGAKKHVPQAMSEKQVRNILKFIDASEDDETKERIFEQLGYECFFSRNLDKWIDPYVDNVQGFLDRVNVEHKSKYWEKLEFNEDRTVLTLTGRKVEGCACSFSDCPNPPKSLCHHCCRNFQQELFGRLLGRKVEVEVTTGFLLGDDHCDTIIRLV
ncbi:MAG: hypothetical protein WAO20_20195, partial [Acidobacteriota bacterium]